MSMTKDDYKLPDDRRYLNNNEEAQVALFANSVKDLRNKRELINEFLLDNFGIEFSTSGLTKKLKQWSQMITESDEVANWHGDYIFSMHNVPKDNIKLMHQIWRRIQNDQVAFVTAKFDPSYRMLKWWDYIISFYGDTITEDIDIITIGNMLSLREMSAAFHNKPFAYQDILCWLDAAPFAGVIEYQAYCLNSKVPKLNWIGADTEYRVGSDGKYTERKLRITEVLKKTKLSKFNQDFLVTVNEFAPTYLRYLLPGQFYKHLDQLIDQDESTDSIVDLIFSGQDESGSLVFTGEDAAVEMKTLNTIFGSKLNLDKMEDAPSPYGNFGSLAPQREDK